MTTTTANNKTPFSASHVPEQLTEEELAFFKQKLNSIEGNGSGMTHGILTKAKARLEHLEACLMNIYAQEVCYPVGSRVKALVLIDETNFKGKDIHVHANVGDIGTVEYINEDGVPTVRFDVSGSATIVDEILEIVGVDGAKLGPSVVG